MEKPKPKRTPRPKAKQHTPAVKLRGGDFKRDVAKTASLFFRPDRVSVHGRFDCGPWIVFAQREGQQEHEAGRNSQHKICVHVCER